jgi:hypothetical protein
MQGTVHLMHDANPWNLERELATLAIGTARAQLDLRRPDCGLQSLSLNGISSDSRLLAISSPGVTSWPAELIDSYVRGCDLVATYAARDDWPYRPQIYWTAETSAASSQTICTVSLVVSIQTNLLDTHPQIVVESTLPAEDVLLVGIDGDDLLVDSHADGIHASDHHSTTRGLIWRLPGDRMSYAEIMPTSDYRQLSIERRGASTSSQWQIFAEFLEKGVIRRARLQSLFLPRDNDVQLTAEYCLAIEKRPLPLTT